MTRWHSAPAALVALALLAPGARVASADAPASSAPAATIRLEHFHFGPVTATVPSGATVRWLNLDGEVHTVVSLDGEFRSSALDQNDTFEHTFIRPGRYRYVCTLHPQMTGTIEVTATP